MQTLISKDGTKIAYDKRGQGAALILVDGALCFRGWGPIPRLAEALAEHFTVFNFDRRGRGDSGDTLPFAVDREIEDIEVLIDEAGGSAHLYGHSSGAALAMEATLRLGSKIKRLAMYEPPYNADEKSQQESNEFDTHYKKLLAEDRRGEALIFLLEGIGMPKEMVAGIQQSPEWPQLEALAHTVLYDNAAASKVVPVREAARVSVPALLLCGSASYGFMRPIAEALSKAMPHGELRVLEGQGHDADPKVLTPILREFFE